MSGRKLPPFLSSLSVLQAGLNGEAEDHESYAGISAPAICRYALSVLVLCGFFFFFP